MITPIHFCLKMRWNSDISSDTLKSTIEKKDGT